jgi:hypothetical protein
LNKRKDPDYDLWTTDDDDWDGMWANYECRCSNGHTWCEVVPEYLSPDICPKCGDFMIEIGPGLYKIEGTPVCH